ncbi:MAG: hypothetical protein KBI47_00790 [Armatimonadetes bacterium]|nr:hypothetical protein [Armatimonadota bacterium]
MDSPMLHRHEPRQRGLTVSAALVAVGLIAAGSLWVQKVSLISHTCQVSEGTPSVPALMGLLLLSGLVIVLRLNPGVARRELLIIYTMMSIGVALSSDNVMRQLFPALTSMRYFAGPENDYALFAEYIPRWLAVADDEAARQFCEGSDGGAIPWGAWALPLLTWGGVFVGYSLCLYCLLALFRKPWADQEHLSFPLVQLAMDLAPGSEHGAGRKHALAQPLFWIGFAGGFVFNAVNIAHAFSPGIPAMGVGYDFGALFTQQPWTGIRPLYLAFRPEIVGLGYLVPLDILLSSWFFYILLRFENFFAQLMGYSIPEFPFEGPQAMGAYLGLMLALVYMARNHLAHVVKAAVGAVAADDAEEAVPYRLAFWAGLGGLAGMVLLCNAAGVGLPISVSYIALSAVAAVVYGRLRAQAGLPISYIVPREETHRSVMALWRSPGRLGPTALKQETNFAVLTVIARMTFPQLAAFEMEGMRQGDLARIRRGDVLGAILIALVVGTAVGYWTHLAAAYEYGNNILDGGTTVGGWRTRQSVIQYDLLQARYTAPVGISIGSTIARIAGIVLVLALVWLRSRFLRFPLNPVGYAIGTAYGYHTWFPIFCVWLAKSLILRLGGARLYRQVTPVFLGLAVGHMLTAGGVWGIVGTFDEDVGRRYLIWFT